MSILKKLIKVLLIVVIASAAWRYAVVFKDSYLAGERAPYIQMLTSDSVVIRWMTAESQLGIIRFSEDYHYLSSLQLEAAPTKNHSVKLTDLKPATRYYYQTGEVASIQNVDIENQWFYTPAAATVATRIWVMGDSGQPGETLNQVRDAAYAWMHQQPRVSNVENALANPGPMDVWLALGNMAYKSGSNEQFQAALFEPFGKVLANTVVWPILGHRDDRRWAYFKIFDLPEGGEAGGVASHTENYYSMDYSNIHFVMLDSQSSSLSTEGDMLNWLRQDLATNKNPWVIVALHHPPYSKGSYDSDNADGRSQQIRENVLPVLEAADVDLVLSSYSHNYERSHLMGCAYQPSAMFSEKNIVSHGVNSEHKQYIKSSQKSSHQGTIYAVVGSSSTVGKSVLDHPANHISLLEPGSMVIDVKDNKLTARFIDSKAEVRDEFSISKEDGYQSSYHGCE